MKNFFNPFVKYSEQKLLLIGLVSWGLINLAMVLFDSRMNGLLHIADGETNVLKNLQITNGVFFFLMSFAFLHWQKSLTSKHASSMYSIAFW